MTDRESGALLPPNARMNPDFVRGMIEAICELWEKDDGAGGDFRAELDPARAVAIHTHAHHTVRMARALLVLDGATKGAEIIPTVRLILECGVTAAWLLVTEGSGDAMIRKGSDQRRLALTAMAGIGVDVKESLAEAKSKLDELDQAGVSKAWVFEQHCKGLKGGDVLWALYRVFSAQSHAGMSIADLYCVADDSSPIGLAFAADLPAESEAQRVSALGIAASMLLAAVNADELARAKPRRSTQIRKLATKLGVGTRIVRADGFELPVR